MKTNTMILLTSFFFLQAIAAKVQAQHCGKIFQKNTNNTLSGVHVYVANKGVTTVSGSDGKYCLNLKGNINHRDTVIFTHVGLEEMKIAFEDLERQGFDIALTEKQQELSEIEVVANKKLDTYLKYHTCRPMPFALSSFGSIMVGDTIYVISGNESVMPRWKRYSEKMLRYAISSDKWITSELKFRRRAYHSLQYHNGRIYVFGGMRLSTNRMIKYFDETVEIYDIQKGTIKIDPVNPHKAICFSTFKYNDNFILMGGLIRQTLSKQEIYTDKIHLFNLQTGYWYELGKLTRAKGAKGVIMDDKIFLAGGSSPHSFTEVEKYDISTGKSIVEAKLPFEVFVPGVTSHKQFIYIFEHGKMQVYNTLTKEIKVYLIDLDLTQCEMFYAHGFLYILGGYAYMGDDIVLSNNLYTVNLEEFDRTAVYHSE